MIRDARKITALCNFPPKEFWVKKLFYLTCGSNTKAAQGRDRSESGWSTGTSIKDTICCGTLTGWSLSGPVDLKQNYLSSSTFLCIDKNLTLPSSYLRCCPVKTNGYFSKAMEPSVGGGAFSRISLTNNSRTSCLFTASSAQKIRSRYTSKLGKNNCRNRVDPSVIFKQTKGSPEDALTTQSYLLKLFHVKHFFAKW